MGLLRFLGSTVVLAAILAGCSPLEPFEFRTFTLRDGSMDAVYADTIRTSGGHGNVQIRLLGGQLPLGVGLRTEDRDGLLYGVPSLAGIFLFTAEARDSAGGEDPGPADVISHGFAITVDSL